VPTKNLDSSVGPKDISPMTDDATSVPRPVTVRAVPIELCQFLKFGGLAESGGSAKQAISERRVLVNGTVETQKRKKLDAGDKVTFEGRTIVVHLG
jgi:ribosome-associated protein